MNKYNKLFNRVKSEKGLSTKETIELFSGVLGASFHTVKGYGTPSKGCPSVSLKLLEMHFK